MATKTSRFPSLSISTNKTKPAVVKQKRSFKAFFGRSQCTTVSGTSSISTQLGKASSSIAVKEILEPNQHIPALPREVLQRIAQFAAQNYAQGSLLAVCDTCLLRDLCSLALVTKKWSRSIQQLMYVRIYLHGHESTAQFKSRFGSKRSSNYGARIKLLRRTLKARPDLALLVRELKMPAYNLSLPRPDIAAIHSLVASVVMECQNLEKLVGFYPVYEFGCGVEDDISTKHDGKWGGGDRLWQALSTRRHLREQVWLLSGDNVKLSTNDTSQNHMHERNLGAVPAVQLPEPYFDKFMEYHSNWKSLQTLVIHGLGSALSLSPKNFTDLFSEMSQLKSLYISHFDPHQFIDRNLFDIPPSITCLRLESLSGVTDRGLSAFFSSRSLEIRKLGLINLEIISLLLVAKIFANLTHLRKFTFLQTISPSLPENEIIFLKPLLANENLRFLHWDCLINGDAERHLASSISEQGFPKLLKLRAPSDETGVLQAVCRPREKVDLPNDKFRSFILKQSPARSKQAATIYSHPSSSSSSVWSSQPSSPISSSAPTSMSTINDALVRHLPTARVTAQKRLELVKDGGTVRPLIEKIEAPLYPSTCLACPSFQMRIIITDCDAPESANLKENVLVHNYLGTVGSQVEYYLLPDVGGSETAVVGLGDIVDYGWERHEIVGSAGCAGQWNREATNEMQQKAKYWWHRERCAWKKVPLDVLF